MKYIAAILFIALLINQVGALTITPASMERALDETETVVLVRILEGKAHFFDEGPMGRIEPCGGVYRAKIIENIVGEETEIEFGINYNMMLVPGGEYLLFLDDRGGLGIESIMFDKADYRSCTDAFPSKMARWRYSSKIVYELDSEQKMSRFVHTPYGVRLPEEFYSEKHGYFQEYVGVSYETYVEFIKAHLDED